MQKVSEDLQKETKLLFRCDVGKKNEIGTGHLIRSLTLAEQLSKNPKIKKKNIIFLTNYSNDFSFIKNLVNENQYTLKFINLKKAGPNSLQEFEIIKKINPQLIIFDRIKTNKNLILKLKKNNIITVLLDDIGSGINYADLAICPIFFHRDLKKGIYRGFKYMIFSDIKYKNKYLKKKVSKISVIFGGFDKRNLFYFFLKNFHKIDYNCHVNLVFGMQKKKINKNILNIISEYKNISTHFRPKNYSEILNSSDLGIVSGGLTLIEFLSIGVPTIALPQYKHQLQTIKKLQSYNCTILGSEEYRLNSSYFLQTFLKAINDYNLRKNLSKNGKRIIDNNGKNRVSELISKMI